jgi:hypothetical protein
MENPDSPQSAKPRLAKRAFIVLLIICSIFTLWYFQQAAWHYRDNLPKEYEEIFATPFNQVNVTEYWNASAGHGTRFEFVFHSTVPIQIKDEPSYEKTKDIKYDKYRYPWAFTSLYRERDSGDVSILLDQSRQIGHVRVHTPVKVAVIRDGRRYYRVANFPWPNQCLDMDEAWIKEWAAREEAKGFQFCDMGPGESLISVTHIIDPRNFQPEEFERQIRQYLRDLEDYNPETVPQKVTEKLLELHVPDRSLSEEQVQSLSKIATELSGNYAEPFDGVTWRIKSRNGKIPVRLKVFIWFKKLRS